MYDPMIFVCWQDLAKAVVASYEADKLQEYKRLQKAKENLYNRLTTGKSRGLIKRWNDDLEIWQSWNKSFLRFENFVTEENTELFKFYKEFAECETASNYKAARRCQLAKRNY